MPKKKAVAPKEKPQRKRRKSRFWKGLFRLFARLVYLLGRLFYIIILGVYYILRRIFKRGKVEANKTKMLAQKGSKSVYGSIASKTKKADIRVLETLKGNYQKFWRDLSSADSRIGIVVGARGSGKSAVALALLENLRQKGKNFFAMGFQAKDLPNWIEVVEDIKDLKNDSFVIIDEGGILFSSRDAMSYSNKMLSELLFIARHKNLTILFISQNSANLEINTLRQADFIILKRSSLLQKNFERKIIADLYDEHQEKFNDYSDVRGLALVFSHSFVGFIDNDLPSFWSQSISKSFSDSK